MYELKEREIKESKIKVREIGLGFRVIYKQF
jgi:hypothetical protein